MKIENPCEAILTPLYASGFELKVEKYIRHQQPFYGDFKMLATIQLNDEDNRGTISLSVIHTWKDSWGLKAAQAAYLSCFKLEITNPSFYRISPPHEDFLFPMKITMSDLAIQVNNACANSPIKFTVDQYSDDRYTEIIRKYINPKFL